jgi:hypothetical protein
MARSFLLASVVVGLDCGHLLKLPGLACLQVHRWKKGHWFRFVSLLVSVIATGTNKAGLKAPAFSFGCLRTGTNGPPRGPDYVMRLEDV